MLSKDKIIELSAKIARDSRAHGYEDHLYSNFRTMTKAACEVAEVLQAYRDRRFAGLNAYMAAKSSIVGEKAFPDYGVQLMKLYDRYIKNSVQDEMADAAIYVMLAYHNNPTHSDLEYERMVPPFLTFDDFVIDAGHIMAGMLEEQDPMLILAYIERWCNAFFNQELELFIRLKMEYNHYRPYRHGRQNDPTV